MKKEVVNGYKVFDKNMKCRDFQYEIGKTYTHNGEIGLCEQGFHFCLKASDCFEYYSFNSENIMCEVEAENPINGDDKSVTNKIKIIKKIEWHEVLLIVNSGKKCTGPSNSGDRNSGDSNSGDWNSGNWNSGNRNSGDWNSGDWNSGDWNSGDWNSGNWNSGDWNSGYLNSNNQLIRIFNKTTNVKNINFPRFFNFKTTEWVRSIELTAKQKKENPHHEIIGGVLFVYDYKESWRKSWDSSINEDRRKVLSLPNWNNDIFKVITGIDANKELGIK